LVNENTTPETSKTDADVNQQILSKLDALDKRVVALEPKPDAKPQKSAEISQAEVVMREMLTDYFPKEKLDAMELNQLFLANDMRKHFKPKKELPDPPAGKGDSKPEEKKPLGYYSTPHGSPTGGVI
jgi:hypothetical protein